MFHLFGEVLSYLYTAEPSYIRWFSLFDSQNILEINLLLLYFTTTVTATATTYYFYNNWSPEFKGVPLLLVVLLLLLSFQIGEE